MQRFKITLNNIHNLTIKAYSATIYKINSMIDKISSGTQIQKFNSFVKIFARINNNLDDIALIQKAKMTIQARWHHIDEVTNKTLGKINMKNRFSLNKCSQNLTLSSKVGVKNKVVTNLIKSSCQLGYYKLANYKYTLLNNLPDNLREFAGLRTFIFAKAKLEDKISQIHSINSISTKAKLRLDDNFCFNVQGLASAVYGKKLGDYEGIGLSELSESLFSVCFVKTNTVWNDIQNQETWENVKTNFDEWNDIVERW